MKFFPDFKVLFYWQSLLNAHKHNEILLINEDSGHRSEWALLRTSAKINTRRELLRNKIPAKRRRLKHIRSKQVH